MQIVVANHEEGENLHILKLARKTANINVKKYSFITVCNGLRPICVTYKTAKVPSITSRAVDIIRTAYLSTLLT